MRKFKFISTLRFLSISGNIDNSFTLMPGINLINDKKKIIEILDEEFCLVAGTIETEHFFKADHILFCDFDEKLLSDNHDSNQALFTWLLWVDMLVKDAWLVKDHTMNCEIAYMRMQDGNHIEWTNNNLKSSGSLSTGEKYKEVKFNINELIAWESKCCKLQIYLHQKNSTPFDSFVDKEFSRIGRSLCFISAARKELHPAIKIAHYCSALESLFSTDSIELSHKLSERVALFLKKYEFDPVKVFDDIKSFYSIRSKVTHGDSIITNKAKAIPELSQKCDNYLRFILNTLLDDPGLTNIFDGSKTEFENYFKKLVLTG